MSTKLTIDIQYASPAVETSVSKIASQTLIKKWVRAATNYSGLLTLRFVNRAEGKKLNSTFRGKNYATNVLTFSYEKTKHFLSADIIFCLPIIRQEANKQSKKAKDHLAHLVIHGCLHAQDFDHETPDDAVKMEKLEIKIMKKLGFHNPYESL